MDDPDYEQRINYWLNVADSFSFDRAKVVVVGTHRDQLKDREAVADAIVERVKSLTADKTTVVAQIFVSCLDDVGTEIQNALVAAADQAGLLKKQVPHVYNVIQDWTEDQKMRNKQQPYFTWKAFVECFSGYNDFLLERACEFLHNMGVLFLGKRTVGRESVNMVFVNVQWLASAFSAVITFRHTWVKDGKLHQEALSHIWREFGFANEGEILGVMGLFEKFSIVFPHRNEGVWVIPSMLAAKAPKSVQKLGSHWLFERKYCMSVIPSGVFGKLMAKVSGWKGGHISEMWRYGFVTVQGDYVASVTVEKGCDIFLRLKRVDDSSNTGHQEDCTLLRYLNEELDHALQYIFRRKETMPYEKRIMCPHCIRQRLKKRTWIDFPQVVASVLSGKSHFMCGDEQVLLDQMGDDLTLGYVKTFAQESVKTEATHFAQGGFGRIYKGVLEGTVPVVVKELIVEGSAEMKLFAELQHEVSVMSKLHHENVVQLYGIMLGPLRMVLELCNEGDLIQCLSSGKVKTQKLKLRIGLDIAKGMQVLHACDPPIAHRDLRSPNVLMVSLNPTSTDAIAKVGDFGLAAAATTRLQLELETWQWMAPEAVLGENYLETCDLYSFGIILWELMVAKGDVPFQAVLDARGDKNSRKLMDDVCRKGVRPELDKRWPENLTHLISRLWDGDATKRPPFAVCVEYMTELMQKKLISVERLAELERAHARRLQFLKRETAVMGFSLEEDGVPPLPLEEPPANLSSSGSVKRTGASGSRSRGNSDQKRSQSRSDSLGKSSSPRSLFGGERKTSPRSPGRSIAPEKGSSPRSGGRSARSNQSRLGRASSLNKDSERRPWVTVKRSSLHQDKGEISPQQSPQQSPHLSRRQVAPVLTRGQSNPTTVRRVVSHKELPSQTQEIPGKKIARGGSGGLVEMGKSAPLPVLSLQRPVRNQPARPPLVVHPTPKNDESPAPSPSVSRRTLPQISSTQLNRSSSSMSEDDPKSSKRVSGAPKKKLPVPPAASARVSGELKGYDGEEMPAANGEAPPPPLPPLPPDRTSGYKPK
jgi:hypothetical protein